MASAARLGITLAFLALLTLLATPLAVFILESLSGRSLSLATRLEAGGERAFILLALRNRGSIPLTDLDLVFTVAGAEVRRRVSLLGPGDAVEVRIPVSRSGLDRAAVAVKIRFKIAGIYAVNLEVKG